MIRPNHQLSTLRRTWASRSPFLLFAGKSAVAAGLSWAIVSSLLGDEAAELALVSAVIVVQVTSWQTARRGLERVLGVLVGATLAVLVGHVLGLNFWTVTFTIFCAQLIGTLLQNRGQYLATQIPISAALALVLGVTASTYPLLRLVGALVGGLIGTIMSLLLSPPVYVYQAREAVADSLSELTSALPTLADALAGRRNEADNRETYTHIRQLEQRVRATERAYALGMESTRLDPWARHASRLLVEYPDLLLALDRLVRQMRRIAYTIDEAGPSWSETAQTQKWPLEYAELLEEVGGILQSAEGYIRPPALPPDTDLRAQQAEKSLSTSIERAQQRLRAGEAQLARDKHEAQQIAAKADSDDGAPTSAGNRIAVRGALLTDLRRMLDEAHDVVEITARSSVPGETSRPDDRLSEP